MEHLNDKDLVRRILDGETNRFSEVLKRYQRPVHSMIRQIITCREEAEELTQDVFVKAFRSLGSFRGECSLSTWLCRIAYNTAVSATRKKKLYFPDLDDYVLNNLPDETVDEVLEKTEDEALLQRLEAAIDTLNAEEKALISLYYTEDKPIADIATILRLSQDNVKVKLYRIRKKLVILTTVDAHE